MFQQTNFYLKEFLNTQISDLDLLIWVTLEHFLHHIQSNIFDNKLDTNSNIFYKRFVRDDKTSPREKWMTSRIVSFLLLPTCCRIRILLKTTDLNADVDVTNRKPCLILIRDNDIFTFLAPEVWRKWNLRGNRADPKPIVALATRNLEQNIEKKIETEISRWQMLLCQKMNLNAIWFLVFDFLDKFVVELCVSDRCWTWK